MFHQYVTHHPLSCRHPVALQCLLVKKLAATLLPFSICLERIKTSGLVDLY